MKKALFGLAALAAAGSVNASIIPSLEGDPVDVGGGQFAFTYSATLASDQALFSGSYFTLYDIRGFSGFGDVPADWTPSAQLVGITPSNVLPSDDPSILNVTFTYSGPVLNYQEDESEHREYDLGRFVIFSSMGSFGFEDFTSEAIKNSGAGRGTLVATIGEDAIAVPGGGGAGAIPEPGTWAMLIAGFGVVGAAARRRKSDLVRTSA